MDWALDLELGLAGVERTRRRPRPPPGATVSSEDDVDFGAASEEIGEEIKSDSSLRSPVRSPLYGITDEYCVERWEEAVGDGLVCGDGKKHPVFVSSSEILVRF